MESYATESPKLILGMLPPVNRNSLSARHDHATCEMAVGVDDRSIGVEMNEKTARILPMRSQQSADGMKYKIRSLTSALLIADLSSITATGGGAC